MIPGNPIFYRLKGTIEKMRASPKTVASAFTWAVAVVAVVLSEAFSRLCINRDEKKVAIHHVYG